MSQAPEQPQVADLLQKHLPALRAYVRLRMGPVLRSREESSDLVQSTCRQLFQKLDSFEYRSEAAFRDWLYTAALNKIIDKTRHHGALKRDAGREVGLSDASDDQLIDGYGSLITPSRDAAGREQVRRFESAFDRLTDEHKEIILLARFVGLSHAEIGERLGRTEGAARKLLFRALARLSTLLRPGRE